jgi:hypothetical protein
MSVEEPARENGVVSDAFASRFAKVRSGPGPLVWGLDPSKALLEAWGLGDDPDGLDRFADIVLGAAVGTVGLVKPQSAFFERHGWRGFRTLSRLIADARSAGLLVVLDAKRGDVGSPTPPTRKRSSVRAHRWQPTRSQFTPIWGSRRWGPSSREPARPAAAC